MTQQIKTVSRTTYNLTIVIYKNGQKKYKTETMEPTNNVVIVYFATSSNLINNI